VSPGLRAIGEIASGELYYAGSLYAVNQGADRTAMTLGVASKTDIYSMGPAMAISQ
jgi:hypothetical protein